MDKHCIALRDAIRTYNSENGNNIGVREAEPMAPHTTFRIGGPADLYLEPSTEADVRFLFRAAREAQARTIMIGRGSNLLFSDDGFRGAVISASSLRELSVDGNILTAGAGVPLRICAKAAQEASLTGMEFAHGIPGSCGGAVFMNAGAYDGEIAQILIRSRYYDRDTDSFGELDAPAHAFGYRESVYRTNTNRVILSASFRLLPGDPLAIRTKMDDLMRRRTEKQPLEYPSAGSTFKRYPGRYTAQMIDEAGLKGYSIGGAQVSEKHAGFIINRGGATSEDVTALIKHIQKTLLERFGVSIETEVVCVPEK